MFRPLAAVTLFLSLSVWALAPATAWGWGKEGHIIVAKIAELGLTDEAKKALGGITELSIADDRIANWPDHIRHVFAFEKIFPDNAQWHFVDIPKNADSYDPEREAAFVAKILKKDPKDVATDNIIEQVLLWKQKLRNPKKPMDRLDALRFLVHFAGDIHQPLHCANNNDRGGNDISVSYLNTHDNHMNLHSVWDVNLVKTSMHLAKLNDPTDAVEYARKIEQAIKAKDRQAWGKVSDPKDWAAESHKLAVDVAYKFQPAENGGLVRLDQDYVGKAAPVVEQQLQKAGVRLAKLLNDAFAE